MSDESMMETTKYQFPLAQLQKQEFPQEISKPITMTLEEIKIDMNNYAKKFPINEIPHIQENEIIDPIHNYRRFEASAKP